MAACLSFVGNEYWLSYLETTEISPSCSEFHVLTPAEYAALSAGGSGDPGTGGSVVTGEVLLTTGVDEATFESAQESILLALVISAAFWLILKQLR